MLKRTIYLFCIGSLKRTRLFTPLNIGSYVCRRPFSNLPIKVSDEVQHALKGKHPVVALESTIITHGLPYPENFKMAQEVESIVRSEGATPATIAFIDGTPTVGICESSLERLAIDTSHMAKVSRRDIGHVMSHKLSGGTTIAATMIFAHKCGIKVFATGGLGGVHRDSETTMDVSADLDELARTPVSVVCSGPKSILDIPKTIEYLETKGVYVSTFGSAGTNIPGFYTADSGVASPYNFGSPEEAANIIYAANSLKLDSGSVFCIPAPSHLSMQKEFIDSIIEKALSQAKNEGISGKELTPYLLKQIWVATDGKTLNTNVGFVKNNASIGSKIAVHLSHLENQKEDKLRNVTNNVNLNGPTSNSNTYSGLEPISSHTLNRSTLFSKHTEGNKLPDALIIGAVAEDLTCCISDGAKDDSFLYTSHPGTIKSSIGGVAYNIARTASYINSNVQLVSEVDSETILTQLANEGLDTSGIKKSNMPTSRFVAIHNGSGELLTAVADMDTIAHMSTDHIKSIIENCKPKIVFFDGNLGPAQKTQIIKSAKSVGSLIGFEPTSVSKASKIAQISLDVFPNNKIDIATPNKLELEAMFSAFSSNGMFDVENWFPVIDVLNINQEFRMAMESLSKSSPDLQQLVSSGMSQQAFHLLPYIPTLLVKDGSNGVTLFQLLTEISAIKRSVCSSSSSRICVGQNDLGIVVQHFPAYPTSNDKIINVNGAGDTLLGVILSELAIDTSWIYTIGDEKNLIMDKAQFAASLTLQSDKSVSPALGSLKEYI